MQGELCQKGVENALLQRDVFSKVEQMYMRCCHIGAPCQLRVPDAGVCGEGWRAWRGPR